MKTVRDLLDVKGGNLWSVAPDQTVYEALALMAEREVGAVLVFEGGRMVGILSERDYARQVILKGKASKDTPVREIMTPRVITVGPDQCMDDCMAIMTNKRVRHLPVVVGDRVVGILSIGDVVKAVISEKQSHIEQLEDYIKTAG
jgi:CBS domain-containing protein